MNFQNNDERRKAVEIANKTLAMTQTDGWKGLSARLIGRKETILNSDFQKAKTYEDFVRIQCAVLAIDGVLSHVDLTIKLGELAAEELGKNPD